MFARGRAALCRRMMEDLADAVRQVRAGGVPDGLDKKEAVSLMKRHLWAGDVGKARAVFDAAPDADRDLVMWTTRMGWAEGLDEALAILDHCFRTGRAPDQRAYIEALRVCHRMGDVEGVLRVLHMMDANGHPKSRRTAFYSLALCIARHAALADPASPPARFRLLWARMLRDGASSLVSVREYALLLRDLDPAADADVLRKCKAEFWPEYQRTLGGLLATGASASTPPSYLPTEPRLRDVLVLGIQLSTRLRQPDITTALAATLRQHLPRHVSGGGARGHLSRWDPQGHDAGRGTYAHDLRRRIAVASSVDEALACMAEAVARVRDRARRTVPGAGRRSDGRRRLRVPDAAFSEAMMLCRRHRDLAGARRVLALIADCGSVPSTHHYAVALAIARHAASRDPSCAEFIDLWRRMLNHHRASPNAVYEYLALLHNPYRKGAAADRVGEVLPPLFDPHVSEDGPLPPQLLLAALPICSRLRRYDLAAAVRSIANARFPDIVVPPLATARPRGPRPNSVPKLLHRAAHAVAAAADAHPSTRGRNTAAAPADLLTSAAGPSLRAA